MNCILLDPLSTKNLWPLSATRPIAGIRIGIQTIEEKWVFILKANISHLCRKELSTLYPINLEEENIIIAGNILPNEELIEQVKSIQQGIIFVNEQNEVILTKLDKKSSQEFIAEYYRNQLNSFVEKNNCKIIHGFKTLQSPWQIFQWNGEEIIRDYTQITAGRQSAKLSNTNQMIGDHFFIEEGAKVECSILNSSTGPIYIGRDAEVMEGSMIRGPFALCNNASLKLGTKIYGPTTIGPHCKVGGEVNNSIFQSNSNKAHDGFIGNSVIGEWCNIGADSNNSNLKNTYAEVRLWNYSTNNFAKTGSIFCGLIMGDHAKCGINTMFNTGTVVGVGANVFGSGFPRQFIPDFAWGGASGFTTFKLNEFFETARAVMARRNTTLNQNQIDLLQQIFEQTSSYRNWE